MTFPIPAKVHFNDETFKDVDKFSGTQQAACPAAYYY